MKLQDKVIAITGAGGIICSEFAKALAKEGAKVALLDINYDAAKQFADEIGENAIAIRCNCLDKESIIQAKKEINESFGAVNFLVNGAGGNNVKAMPTITAFDSRELTGELPEGQKGLYDIDMDAFSSVIKINTMGTVIPTMEFAKQMAKKGGGVVINFASMNTYCPLTRCFAYAMSKSAVSNLTQSFGAYFAPANIRVNAIAPGFMVNERSKTYLGTVEEGLTKRGEQVISHTPMGRFGKAEDS